MNPATLNETQTTSPVPANPKEFTHQIEIRPLGHLYGSAGPFLSPENLVGRAGAHFPPSAMTFAGLVAAIVADEKAIKPYQFAGPFWAWQNNLDNIYIPTPFNCLVKDNQIQHQMAWRDGKWQAWDQKTQQWQTPQDDKYQAGTWLSLETWQQLNPSDPKKLTVEAGPWQFTPYLHPKLQLEQRKTVEENGLFLENAVALNPDACLVYLCNHAVEPGWYRFGGEGHMVELSCRELGAPLKALLGEKCDRTFATITPAVWGSNRRSLRSPRIDQKGKPAWPEGEDHNFDQTIEITALLTGKPLPLRHRIGKPTHKQDPSHFPNLLSRGRYAMPAGTVYVLDEQLGKPWHDWPLSWFPTEGYSYKCFGCGLALPLKAEG
ncbi:MAG: type III-B CRISPR module-associated Cmr3 family protein [Spirulinaceae cyanobacterium]